MPTGWPARDSVETSLFWGAWVLAMAHAFLRSGPVAQGRINPAWREQCWAIAVLAVAAVALNGLTTGDHLWSTLTRAYWPVAGVDLFMLAGAVLALIAARRLKGPSSVRVPATQAGAVHG